MGVEFKLVLNDQEQLIYHCLNIVYLSNQVTTKIQHVMSTLPDLSSEGAYHDLIANSETNGGLALFYKKAQEFVLYRHAQNTYETMVNTDKVLATAIAEMILKDPASSVAYKEAIRKDPKGSVEQIMKNRQTEAQGSGAK